MSATLIPKGSYYSAGPTLVDMGLIANGGGHSWTTGATATTGGQSGALRLRAQWNFIDGVQGAGSGVMLPLLTGGQLIYISNRATSDVTVWVAVNTTDTIVGVGTSETLPAGTTRTYVSVADGWIEWIATGGSSTGPFLPLSGGTLTANLGTVASASVQTINSTAGGSGTNGPATAQFGLSVSHVKQDWNDPTQSNVHAGEIDGIYVYCRQGGSNSDCGAVLVNAQSTGLSYLAMLEGTASIVNVSTSAITKQVGVTLGALDGVSNTAQGVVVTSNTGSLNTAIQVQDTTGAGTWTNVLTNTHAGSTNFTLDSSGNITTTGTISSGNITTSGVVNSNGLHGQLYLRSDTAVSILYDGATGGIQFNIGGNAAEILGSGALTIFGTKVVGAQVAGWGTPTGGSRISNFPGGTATAAQTAQALAQLILDLKAHGLLGA